MGGSTLERIVALLLRPVVRFSLRHSLKIQDLVRVLKAVLLEIAQEELGATSKTVTVSQLSASTGIPRKFIPELLSNKLSFESSGNFVTRLIGAWQQDARLSSKGAAKPLGIEGADSDFSKLVRSVSADLNPYTVLFELQRVGAISREGGTVTLKKRLYLEKDCLEGFTIAAQDADSLIGAVEENLLYSIDPKNLHLSTYFDNIPDDNVAEIRRWLLAEGTQFQERVRAHLAAYDKDMNPTQRKKSGRNVVRVGSFSCVNVWRKEGR